MFDRETIQAVERHSRRTGLETAIILAVAEVESAGRVFATVSGRQEPLIRWEGHYFDRRLSGVQQSRARSRGLASPRAGVVKNPRSQQARWDKLFNPASQIDAQAAFESTSWGLGQVMGAHWKKLNFQSWKAMMKTARSGAAGQIDLMIRYIEEFGLVDELKRGDFRAFARGYNGPGGIRAGYHKKIARVYGRLSGRKVEARSTGMLAMGSRGAGVRELQALLVRAGFTLKVDGDFGPSTRDSLREFQRRNGLTVDGIAGPETMSALSSLRTTPDETPGREAVTDVREVRDAAKGMGPVAVVMSLRDQLAEFGYSLFGLELETAQIVANGLLALSGAVGAGLAIYGVYGWWRSRQTQEEEIYAGPV